MPVPIVAGAAAGGRVVAGSVVRTQGRTPAKKGSAIADNRRRRLEAPDSATMANVSRLTPSHAFEGVRPKTVLSNPRNLRGKQAVLPKKLATGVFRAAHMARVMVVHISCALPLFWLYLVQLVGYVIYTFMSESMDFILVQAFDVVVADLDWIWMVGWGIGTLAGLASVALLMAAYSTALINWLKLWSIAALLLTITLYFAPMLLVVPWVLLWMTVIFWSK